MKYQDIINSINDAKSSEDLILIAHVINKALDDGTCEYNDLEDLLIKFALNKAAQTLPGYRTVMFCDESIPTCH